MPDTAAKDALLLAAISNIEEMEAIVVMMGVMDGPSRTRVSIAADLREVAGLFAKLPLIENDLKRIKGRLRTMLSSDPDKTPQAIDAQDTKYSSVESRPSRQATRRGIGNLGGTKLGLPPKKE